MLGKTISHYKILEKLGGGGMGVVYKAEDTKLKRTVALKFLPPNFALDDDAKQRFVHEAQSASALDHFNICTIYEIDETPDLPAVAGGQLFIAMAFYDGETLKKKIENGPLQINEVIEISIQIAEGLNAAHNKGIVHRDIKPANIFITNEGVVKILDFGLAKSASRNTMTQLGSTMGTVAYMSPEQSRGGEVNHLTDIWSLGVVMYEMLTGQQPFIGDYEQAVIYSILNEEPNLDLLKELNEDIKQIIKKALSKNVGKRYNQMNEILSELKSLKILSSPPDILLKNIDAESSLSIAVLPFVNMSADKENEYFSDGLTEELINALSKIKELQVVARTSVFVFKGKESDIRDIGKNLNVEKILEGSVRKAGDTLRITAQLINVVDGYHIWSEKYDRKLDDVFAIQDDISFQIAEKLISKLVTVPTIDQDKHPINIEAYDLYLKGRYYFNKFLPEWINRAIESFSEAIATDPEFALAYAGLAEAHVFLSTPFGALESAAAMPKAKAAAEKALELHPNLSEAYVVMGAIATFYDWDREKAHQYFRQTITLNPNNVNARLWYELALSLLDQDYDEALAQLTVALELDPLNLLVMIRMGYVYCYKYDFDTAIQYFNKILHIEPSYAMGYHGLMDIYGMKGEYELAITYGEKAVELGGYSPPTVAILGSYCGRGGKQKRASELLSMLLERSKTEHISPFWIGIIYLGFKDLDQMFEWFGKAYQQRDGNLLYLFAPPFDSIRNDPRFIELRKKMGFEK